MSKHFSDIDLSNFWDESDYSTKNYISAPATAELIASIEEELGYKLPLSYIELTQTQNGGILKNRAFRTSEATSWAPDHAAIEGIFGIGREKRCSLGGEAGSRFMIDEWGYPEIGIYFGDCPPPDTT